MDLSGQFNMSNHLSHDDCAATNTLDLPCVESSMITAQPRDDDSAKQIVETMLQSLSADKMEHASVGPRANNAVEPQPNENPSIAPLLTIPFASLPKSETHCVSVSIQVSAESEPKITVLIDATSAVYILAPRLVIPTGYPCRVCCSVLKTASQCESHECRSHKLHNERRCCWICHPVAVLATVDGLLQQHLPTVHKLKFRDAALAANEQARLNALLSATSLANTSESVVLGSSSRGPTKPVDFICSFCARQFQRALHLEEHEDIEHDAYRVERTCPLCPRRAIFRTRDALCNHTRHSHSVLSATISKPSATSTSIVSVNIFETESNVVKPGDCTLASLRRVFTLLSSRIWQSYADSHGTARQQQARLSMLSQIRNVISTVKFEYPIFKSDDNIATSSGSDGPRTLAQFYAETARDWYEASSGKLHATHRSRLWDAFQSRVQSAERKRTSHYVVSTADIEVTDEVKSHDISTPVSVSENKKQLRASSGAATLPSGGVLQCEVFGSCAYGMATAATSDIDLALLVAQSRSQGWLRLHAIEVLRKVAYSLRGSRKFDVLPILNARVPLLRVSSIGTLAQNGLNFNGNRTRNSAPATTLSCDISVGDQTNPLKTALLRDCCQIFPPLRPLICALKHFIHVHDLGDASTSSLSLFAWSMMLIQFLQRRGCLPFSLDATRSLQNVLQTTCCMDPDHVVNVSFVERALVTTQCTVKHEEVVVSLSVDVVPEVVVGDLDSSSRMSIGSILNEKTSPDCVGADSVGGILLQIETISCADVASVTCFDYDRDAVSITAATPFSTKTAMHLRSNAHVMAIQDPIDPSDNLARSLSAARLKVIRRALHTAAIDLIHAKQSIDGSIALVSPLDTLFTVPVKVPEVIKPPVDGGKKMAVTAPSASQTRLETAAARASAIVVKSSVIPSVVKELASVSLSDGAKKQRQNQSTKPIALADVLGTEEVSMHIVAFAPSTSTGFNVSSSQSVSSQAKKPQRQKLVNTAVSLADEVSMHIVTSIPLASSATTVKAGVAVVELNSQQRKKPSKTLGAVMSAVSMNEEVSMHILSSSQSTSAKSDKVLFNNKAGLSAKRTTAVVVEHVIQPVVNKSKIQQSKSSTGVDAANNTAVFKPKPLKSEKPQTAVKVASTTDEDDEILSMRIIVPAVGKLAAVPSVPRVYHPSPAQNSNRLGTCPMLPTAHVSSVGGPNRPHPLPKQSALSNAMSLFSRAVATNQLVHDSNDRAESSDPGGMAVPVAVLSSHSETAIAEVGRPMPHSFGGARSPELIRWFTEMVAPQQPPENIAPSHSHAQDLQFTPALQLNTSQSNFVGAPLTYSQSQSSSVFQEQSNLPSFYNAGLPIPQSLSQQPVHGFSHQQYQDQMYQMQIDAVIQKRQQLQPPPAYYPMPQTSTNVQSHVQSGPMHAPNISAASQEGIRLSPYATAMSSAGAGGLPSLHPPMVAPHQYHFPSVYPSHAGSVRVQSQQLPQPVIPMPSFQASLVQQPNMAQLEFLRRFQQPAQFYQN